MKNDQINSVYVIIQWNLIFVKLSRTLSNRIILSCSQVIHMIGADQQHFGVDTTCPCGEGDVKTPDQYHLPVLTNNCSNYQKGTKGYRGHVFFLSSFVIW